MSGAEAVGTFASATQLAAYSIKIVLFLNDIYTEVRNTPNRTKKHLNQVRELIEITTLIEQHKSLQSPVVHTQLQTTLSEARSLHKLLKEYIHKYTENSIQRYWAILKGVDDKEILTGLNKLEREKSALRLCISLVHTDLLSNIQGSIDKFSNSRMPTQPGGRFTTAGDTCRSWAERQAAGNATPQTYRMINGEKIPVNSRPNDQEDKISQGESATSDQGHDFRNIRSEPNGTQHAGDQNDSGSGNVGLKHRYDGVSALENSLQVAGNINCPEGIKGFYGSRK